MTLTVTLPQDVQDFIDARISNGYSSSPDEVVQTALQLLAREDAEKVKWLREAWQEGLEGGDFCDFDIEMIKAEARARFGKRSA